MPVGGGLSPLLGGRLQATHGAAMRGRGQTQLHSAVAWVAYSAPSPVTLRRA